MVLRASVMYLYYAVVPEKLINKVNMYILSSYLNFEGTSIG
jgi:hypothetical protein